MENASKALIIAGAILLSILIIALGMNVYNSASSATGSADLSAQELQAHNAQFLAYEGRQKGAQVKALITAIKNNNRDYEDRKIKVTFSSAAATAKVADTDVATFTASATEDNDYTTVTPKTNTTYYVTFGYGDNGCIAGVEIHVYSNVDQ